MRRAFVVSLVMGTLLVPAAASSPAGAATPSSGSVQPGASVTWHGSKLTAPPPVVGTVTGCQEGSSCDTFALGVTVPAGFSNPDASLLVQISWASADNDLDLSVTGPKGDVVGSSQQSGTSSEEVVVRNPVAGQYKITAQAFSGSTDYSGTASFPTANAPLTHTTGNGFAWSGGPVAIDAHFAEPSVDVDHGNRIYVTAPGGAGVQLWRSFDGGLSFDHKEISSPNGGGDSEIEFDLKDVGFTADLAVADSNVSRSTDHFDTWSQQPVGLEQDRQWLAHLCDKVMYLAYHDFVAETELINRSDDEGKTWSKVPVTISPGPGNQDNPGALADQQVNTFSGPVAVDQRTGDVYVVFAISSAAGNVVTGTPPYGDPEQIVVASSTDGGKSFSLQEIAKGGPGDLAGVLFPWVTVDDAGNVYAAYARRVGANGPIDIDVTYSNDHGKTWSQPYRVNQDVGNAHIYATVSAGDPGVLDVAWYSATTPDPGNAGNDWHVDFAQVRNANTPAPQITQSRPWPDSIHHGEVCLQGILCVTGGDRSLLDFFQVQVGPDGMANIAFADNGNATKTLQVHFVRQTAGPSAGNGLHDTSACVKSTATGAAAEAAPGGGTSGAGSGGSSGARGGALPATGGGSPWLPLSGAAALTAAWLAWPGRRSRHARRA